MHLVTVVPQWNSSFIDGRRAEPAAVDAQRNNYISLRFHSQFNHVEIIEFLSAWCNSVVLQPLAGFKEFANAMKTIIDFIDRKLLLFFYFTFEYLQAFCQLARCGVLLDEGINILCKYSRGHTPWMDSPITIFVVVVLLNNVTTFTAVLWVQFKTVVLNCGV